MDPGPGVLYRGTLGCEEFEIPDQAIWPKHECGPKFEIRNSRISALKPDDPSRPFLARISFFNFACGPVFPPNRAQRPTHAPTHRPARDAT